MCTEDGGDDDGDGDVRCLRCAPGLGSTRKGIFGNVSLTVRLLVAGAGTGSSKLLGLAASGISNKKGSVKSKEPVLDLALVDLIAVCLLFRHCFVIVSQQRCGRAISSFVVTSFIRPSVRRSATRFECFFFFFFC